jgi:hypothetical protein
MKYTLQTNDKKNKTTSTVLSYEQNVAETRTKTEHNHTLEEFITRWLC